MKKALIIKSEFDHHLVGEIHSIGEAVEVDKLNGNLYNKMEKVELPVELEGIPRLELKGVLVPDMGEFWSKVGEANVSINPLDVTWTYVPSIPEHWEIQKGDAFVAYDKKTRVNVEYNKMNTRVLVEMSDLFKTEKSDSATRTYLTLMSMSARPAKFAGKGIVAMYDVLGFAIGDALDTEAKVKEFADQVLDKADDYSVFALQEIQKFQYEKAVINAE